MKTAAVMMMRDEWDVAEGVVRHALGEVDAVYVLDNGSTDGTRDILQNLAATFPIKVLDDHEPGYYQSQKMTALAERAAADGYGYIVPMDADEIWSSPDGRRIADVLSSVDSPVVGATLYDHVCTGLDLAGEPDPFRSMVWRRRQQGPLPKIALRWEAGAVLKQGNHTATLPSLPQDRDVEPHMLLLVHHFPVRSPEQFVRKVINGSAAYRAATDLPADQGVHWRAWGELHTRYGEAGLQEVFDRYFWEVSPIDAGLVHDPAPYRPGRDWWRS